MLHSPSMLTHSRINQKKIFMTRRDSTYLYFEIIPVCCSSPCVLVITNSIISLSFIISQIDFWNDIVNFNDLEISQFKKKPIPFCSTFGLYCDYEHFQNWMSNYISDIMVVIYIWGMISLILSQIIF